MNDNCEQSNKKRLILKGDLRERVDCVYQLIYYKIIDN